MHELIYVSEACPNLTSEEVFRIVEQSARNNPSAEITGFLAYRSGKFLQLIEGPLLALETLITLLERDSRHHSLRVLSRTPIAERSFPRWRMKRLGQNADPVEELNSALAAEGRRRQLPPAVRQFLQSEVHV